MSETDFVDAIEVVIGPTKNRKFTAESFLEFLRPSNDRWWSSSSQEFGKANWIFRGQSNAAWNLIPAGLRVFDQNSPNWKERARTKLYGSICALGPKDSPNSRYMDDFDNETFKEAIRYSCVIDEAISQFATLARSLSFVGRAQTFSPLSNGDISGSPDARSFTRIPESDFDLIGLAQHHGIPTHFLDWTDNPLFAVHFACMEGKVEEPKDISVWALDESRFVDISVPTTGRGLTSTVVSSIVHVFRSTPSYNQYLAAQRGAFTYYENTQNVRSIFMKINVGQE